MLADLHELKLEAIPVHSAAKDRLTFLQRPDLGRRLDSECTGRLSRANADARSLDAVFVVADGLSAAAVQRHALPVLAALLPTLSEGWRFGPIVVAEQGGSRWATRSERCWRLVSRSS
jgi:ethanolamine ammonia-lyase small subunit